jgi:hypothetical protein
MGKNFAVSGSNEDSPKLQMPTSADQASACFGMRTRLGVNDWWGDLSMASKK